LSGTLAMLHQQLEVLQDRLLYMLDVVYIQISIPWYGYNPIWHLYQCQQDKVLYLFPWMTCHTLPFAFIRVLSTAVIEWSAIPSAANRYPIVDILSFTSVEIAFNRRSNVRLLHGMDTNPQANASLWLY
jgi:hypothetical protein